MQYKAQQELIELERSVKNAQALINSRLAALNIAPITQSKK